ncbi:MAG: hypothetical protein ACI86C_001106 [Candidatus Latescibacterota bacterium]
MAGIFTDEESGNLKPSKIILMKVLLHPTYFPSIVQMAAVAQAKAVVFEVHDNYQKQTYRNRAYIATSTGKLLLNIPIEHSKDGTRLRYNEVQTEDSSPWQSQHWKSLETAYRTSPYFEFYEDELKSLFTGDASKLMAHNFEVFELVCELIGLEVEHSKSTEYFREPKQKDLRYLANVKREINIELIPYTQVFGSNHGFLSNLSILDLIFNEGPNTLHYLESQTLQF